MSTATTRNIRAGIWVLWVGLLLVPSAPVDAEVVIHPPNSDDTPNVFLTTRIITDDDEPIGSAFQTNDGQSTNAKLNADGHLNGDGEPTTLLHPVTGWAIAVWSKAGPEGYDVVLSRFSGGAWTAPQVLVGSSVDELDPFLAVDPADGSVHLLYWVHDTAPRVMHRQAPADLSSWSPAVQVSGVGEIAVRPGAAFVDGALKVVYERHDLGYGSTPRQIVVATKAGSTFTTETAAVTDEAAPNWPLVHARAGRLWVDWLHAEAAMAWTVQGPGGWETLQVEPFAGTEDRTFRVRGRIELQALE